MKVTVIKEMGLFREHCTKAFELYLAGDERVIEGFPGRRKTGSYFNWKQNYSGGSWNDWLRERRRIIHRESREVVFMSRQEGLG